MRNYSGFGLFFGDAMCVLLHVNLPYVSLKTWLVISERSKGQVRLGDQKTSLDL